MAIKFQAFLICIVLPCFLASACILVNTLMKG